MNSFTNKNKTFNQRRTPAKRNWPSFKEIYAQEKEEKRRPRQVDKRDVERLWIEVDEILFQRQNDAVDAIYNQLDNCRKRYADHFIENEDLPGCEACTRQLNRFLHILHKLMSDRELTIKYDDLHLLIKLKNANRQTQAHNYMWGMMESKFKEEAVMPFLLAENKPTVSTIEPFETANPFGNPGFLAAFASAIDHVSETKPFPHKPPKKECNFKEDTMDGVRHMLNELLIDHVGQEQLQKMKKEVTFNETVQVRPIPKENKGRKIRRSKKQKAEEAITHKVEERDLPVPTMDTAKTVIVEQNEAFVMVGEATPEEEPEQIVQPDIKEPLQQLEWEIAEQKRLNNMQRALIKSLKGSKNRKVVKKTKKRIYQATRCLSSISPEQREKYLRIGSARSVQDHVLDVFQRLPKRPVKKQHFELFNRAFSELQIRYGEVTPDDAIQLHHYALLTMRETDSGLPGTILRLDTKFQLGERFEGDMKKVYEQHLLKHYALNEHHPEHQEGMMSMEGTLECMFDLWACAMRATNSFAEAYTSFITWMVTEDRNVMSLKPKFRNLNPLGLLLFYKFVVDNGIESRRYNYAKFLHKNRSLELSEQARNLDWEKVYQMDLNNDRARWTELRKIPEVSRYLIETRVHQQIVGTFLQRVNMPYKNHDKDKFSPACILAYAYEWFVKDKLPIATCDECENPFCEGKGTEGSCFDDENFQEGLYENIKNFTQRAAQGAKKFVTDTIPENVKSLIESIKHQYKEIKQVAQSVMDKIDKFLKPLMDKLGLKLKKPSLDLALDIVRYYIIYINTDSTTIQTICIYSILSSCGVIDLVLEAIGSFLGMNGTEVQIPEEGEPQPTSIGSDALGYLKDAFSGLLTTDPMKIAIPLSLLVFMFVGYKMNHTEMANLSKGFVDSMKNMHFIGAGIIGFSRVFDLLMKAVRYVIDWVGKKFYNKVPEDEQEQKDLEELVKSFSDWAAEVEVLSGDENIKAMASSTVLAARGKTLYEKSLKFMRLKLAGRLPADCARQFSDLHKKARLINNVVTRTQGYETFRVTPFHLQMFGEPGVGKSTIVHSIVSRIKDKYYPDRINMTYTQGDTDHYDGYSDQPVWFIDDMFPADDFQSVIPLLTLISNCPLRLPMAHLEDKGTMFTSDFVLSTTNTPYPVFGGLFKNEAVWRRRHLLVQVTIDPEVKDTQTGKFSKELFQKKFPGLDSFSFPHLRFTLYNPVEQNTVYNETKLPAGLKVPIANISFDEFINRFFGRYESQKQEEALFDNIDKFARMREIKKLLREIDPIYESIKDRPDANTTLYDENLLDPTHSQPNSNISSEEIPLKKEDIENPPADPWKEGLENFYKCRDNLGSEFYNHFVADIQETLNQFKSTETFEDREEFLYLLESLYRYQYVIVKGRMAGNKRMDHFLAELHDIKDTLHEKKMPTWELDSAGKTKTGLVPITRTNLKHLMNQIIYEYSECVREGLDLNCVDRHMNVSIIYLLTTFMDHENHPYTYDDQNSLCAALKEEKERWNQEPIATAIHISADSTNEDLETLVLDKEDIIQKKVENMKEALNHTPTSEYKTAMRKVVDLLEDDAAPGQLMTEAAKLMIIGTTSSVEINSIALKIDKCLKEIAEEKSDIITIKVELNERSRAERLLKGKNRTRNTESFDFACEGNVREHVWEIRKDQDYKVPYYAGQWDKKPCGTLPGKIITHGKEYMSYQYRREDIDWIFNGQKVPTNSCISTGFLEILIFEGNKWFIDTTVLDWMAKRAPPMQHNGFWIIPNGALILASIEWFRESCERFFALSFTQQKKLFDAYQNQRKYLRILTNLYRRAKSRAVSIFTTLWNKITGAASYVWETIKPYKNAIGIAAFAIAIIAICTMFSRLFIPEATSVAFGRMAGGRRHGIPMATSAFDIPTKVMDAVTPIVVGKMACHGFKITAKCLLLPWHAVVSTRPEKNGYINVSYQLKFGQYINQYFPYANFVRIPDTDMCVLHHVDLPQWACMIKYLYKNDDFKTEFEPFTDVIIKSNGTIEILSSPYVGQENNIVNRYAGFEDEIKIGGVTSFETTMKKGMSGAPVLLYKRQKGSPSCISGFQAYVLNGRSYGSNITQEQFRKIYDHFGHSYVTLEGPLYGDQEAQPTCADIIEENMPIYGTVPTEKQLFNSGKSKIVASPIYGEFKTNRVPAILSPTDPKACGDPIKNSLNKHGRDSMLALHPILLKESASEYALFFKNQFKHTPYVRTFEEAILGWEGMDHINLTTSPGIPYVHSRLKSGKHDLLHVDQSGELEYYSPDLLSDVEHMIDQFSKDNVPEFLMMEVMKDELRPMHKAYGLTEDQAENFKAGTFPISEWPKERPVKTRSITVMPLTFTIIYRMYFADLFNQLYKKADGTNEYCIGINPESPAAFNAFKRATTLSDHGYDFDVGNWDGHYSPQIARTVCDIVNECYNDGTENAKIRRSLIEAMLFGFIQYRDAIYQKQWGLVSGFPGTADFNTVGHMLVALVFWKGSMIHHHHPELMPLRVKQMHTLDLFYGDDRLLVVDDLVEPFYNGVINCKSYIQGGWPVTAADKGANPTASKPIKNLQFLKRTFVPDEENPFYVKWAIEKETINDLCCFIRKTPNLTYQFNLNINQALDFATDWGKEYFDEFKNQLDEALVRKKMPRVVITYSQMRREKITRYFGCNWEVDRLPILIEDLGTPV